MLAPLLISIFAQLCIATDPGQISTDQLDQSRSDPVIRWTGLQRQIYDKSVAKIDLALLQTILRELSSIEQDDKLKSHELYVNQDKRYKQLIQVAYESNILDKPDATITDLLLQTLDHNSNGCTKEYLHFLNELYKHFRDTPITDSLQENQNLQYKNCLERSKRLLSTIISSLGSRVKKSLDNLLSAIYPDSNKLIEFPLLSQQVVDYCNNSTQIGVRIAQFLAQQKVQQNQDALDSKLQHFVLQPCSILINESGLTLEKILPIIRMSRIDRNFLEFEHAMFVNKYQLCRIILDNVDFIRPIIIQYNNMFSRLTFSTDATHQNQAPSQDFESIGHAKIATSIGDLQEQDVSTELRLGLPTDEQLITQQLPINQIQEGILNPQSSQVGSSKKYVTKIEKGTSRGRKQTYPTHWSDGTITHETKTSLLNNWPDQYKAMYKRLEAEWQAEYVERCLANSSRFSTIKPPSIFANVTAQRLMPMDKNAIDQKNLSVVKIGRYIGRGATTRYPTHWSDGTVSLETKQYLQQNWHNQLNAARKRRDHDIDDDDDNNNDDRDSARLKKRPRIETLPSEDDPLNEPRVLSIGRSIRRGSTVRFSTNWSDGKRSMEDEEYLSRNWPIIWQEYDRRRKLEEERELRAKSLAANSLSERHKITSIPELPNLTNIPEMPEIQENEPSNDSVYSPSLPISFMDLLQSGSSRSNEQQTAEEPIVDDNTVNTDLQINLPSTSQDKSTTQ